MARLALIPLIVLALLASPQPSYAQQTTYQLPTVNVQPGFVPLQRSTGSALDQVYGSNDLASLFQSAFTIALSVGAMLGVLRLVYAGYMRMVSGVGNWASLTKANEIIGSTILGLVLLLGIYLLMFQIDPSILNLCILRDVPNASCP